MPEVDEEVCEETDGNQLVEGTSEAAHTIMIRETGQCPWCGRHA